MFTWRRTTPRLRLRPGMTLVELLMVLVIVVILLAVIAPIMRMGTQDRRLREAARQVNGYCAGAQARAAERGRPVFVKMDRNSNAALTLSLAEVPPPYTGDVTDALVTSIDPNGANWTVNFGGGHVSQLVTRKLVVGNNGERIRFNFQGHLYPIVSATETTVVIGNALASGVASGVPPVIPSGAKGASFQIYRAPVPTSAAPLTLPAGTAIDLSSSGSGLGGTQFSQAATDTTPVLVGFSPTGGVSGVLYTGGTITAEAVHLLVGRNDKLGSGNLQDPNAIWISVNPTTGIVTTTDNFPSATVATARQYANSAQNLGGR